ncbi:serine/threonine-protein kinase ATR-like isoform X2 [Clavelina lepadiformis]|uniref:serine/threonine-protein kinase ATR-like isoform X2 n=1 Tax=Clavelina lepadiformis TaxID=159417 RepID=UPI0040432B7E
MECTEEILKSIVNDYKKIKGSNEQIKSKCQKIRKNLQQIIKQQLADINQISYELKKAKDQSSQTETILNFFYYLLAELPHPVFVPSTEQCNAVPLEQRSAQFHEYYDFLYLLFSRLAQLLSCEQLSAIHDVARKILLLWLQLIKTKNISIYHLVLNNIFDLLSELHVMEQNNFQICNDVAVPTILPLQTFKVENPFIKEIPLLSITSYESMECWQIVCCKLLQELACDITLFLGNKMKCLWDIIFHQVQFGLLSLKAAAFNLIMSLLDHLKLSEQVQSRLVYCCIIPLVKYVVGGSVKTHFIEVGISEDEVKEYDVGVSCFLKHLFKTTMAINSYIPRSNLLLSIGQLSDMLECFLTSVGPVTKWDDTIMAICQYILVSAVDVNVEEQAALSSDFVENCDKFMLLLLQARSKSGQRHTCINLTFCYIVCLRLHHDVLINVNEPTVEVRKVYRSPLARKHHRNASDGKEKNSSKTSDFQVQFYDQIKDFCLNVYKQYENLGQKLKNKAINSKEVFTMLTDSLNDLLDIFQPLVNALIMTKQNKEDVHVLTKLGREVPFKTVFMKLVEVFVVACGDKTKSQEMQEVTSATEVFGKVVKLSKLFVIWFHVLQDELKMPLSQDNISFLEIVSVLLSVLWIEDMPWQDLKLPSGKFLLKSSLLSLTQFLQSCNFSQEEILKDKSKEHKVVLSDCLSGLVYLPSNIAVMWRCSVVVKWALSSNCQGVESNCLNLFSCFCSKLKKHSAGITLISPLLEDISYFLKAKSSSHVSVLNCVVRQILPLSLVLSDDFTVFSKVSFVDENCQSFQIHNGEAKPKQSLDEKYMSFFNNIEKCVYSNLSSIDENDCVFAANMLNGFASVLQHSNKTNQVGMRILNQWFLHFQKFSQADGVKASLIDGDFDDSLWNSQIMMSVEELIISSMADHNTTLLGRIVPLLASMMKYCHTTLRNEDRMFVWCLKQLCKLMTRSSIYVSSNAYIEIKEASKITQQNNILLHQRKMLCATIIESLLAEDTPTRPLLDILVDTAQLFNLFLEDFLSNNLQYLLPPAVVSLPSSSGDKQEELLTMFCQVTNKSRADITMQHFKHIFCHAVVTDSDLTNLFKFLENQTRIKKESLILLNYGSLIQHLVAHISVNHDRVCQALQIIHEIKENEICSLSMSQLIKPHFLSVLTFFNGQLRLPSVTFDDKKQIYESLICLLWLMDKSDVTAVSVKIINTLCLAQQVFANSTCGRICCKGWDTLIKCVEVSSLGSILSQVAVNLIPFLEQYPSDVARSLEYLVIENIGSTRANLSELYFLPEHDALNQVKLCVERELKQKKQQNNFVSCLEQATKQVAHDSVEVRVYALARLRTILQSNQTPLQRHCLAGGGSSELIKCLASTLLTCCRDSNSEVRLLSVKCLGQIGAISPDKLCLSFNSNLAKQTRQVMFDDQDFAFDLLNCLVQSFLVAKPVHQDISAFAVQELLKIYSCRDGSKDNAGRRLWRRFSEQTQAVLEPHLTSRYMLKKPEMNLSTLKRPILHKKQSMTFREWIGTFCAVLMQMASSCVQEGSKVRGVFEACGAVVRNDVNVALFLLPHTVVEVLKCGEEYTDFIVEEVMAVLESTETLKENKNDPKPTSDVGSLPNDTNTAHEDSKAFQLLIGQSSHLAQLSAQAVFSVMDHVTIWQRQPVPTTGGSLARSKLVKEKDLAAAFLSRIPQRTLALASLRCRAHTRALLHYENYLRQSCGGNCDAASAVFLQRIFVEMDETDGVLGVVNVRGVEPTPETQLKLLESTGALQDAAACYERIIRKNPDDLLHHKGFAKCLIDLGQLSTVVNVIDGTTAQHPNWEHELSSYQMEACWRLGKWEVLEKKIKNMETATKNWNSSIGEAILAIRSSEWQKFDNMLDELYQSQVGPLSAASMESASYQRGYEHILRLHMISDLERFGDGMRDQSEHHSVDDVMSLWQLRLQVVQSTFRAREPMMSLCRVLLPLLSQNLSNEYGRHVGKLWLQSSKLARKCGHVQTAYGALLSAQPYSLPGYCIEHAKWLWKKGESHHALRTLQRGFTEYFSSSSSMSDREEKKTRAKVMLLVAKLMEESSSFDSNTVLRQYKDVVAYMGEWEDAHFYCGQYYDKLMTILMGEKGGVSPKAHHLYYIMHHYGRSLCYGTSHIYESLTKLLTLWLDYGETAARLEKAGRPLSLEDVQRLVDVMKDIRSRLPAYIFYAAFSQLTSRICHQHEPTYNQLKEILVQVIQAFPQRALWSMMAISKSSFKQRAARCQEIFQRVSFIDATLTKLLSDMNKLTNNLLELCNKPVNNIQPLSINTHFKSLKKLVSDSAFSEIILPLQKFMTVTLPQSKSNAMLGSQNSHNPFPESTTHIVGFDDAVEILSSLQRPKKVSVRASDGSSCIFLCKPKDDLRKDARLTEFAAIVNKCLMRDTESGKRNLLIRTYAVVPLNEECGLIEWVNNMQGLRHILLAIYKTKGTYTSGKQLKAMQLPVSETLKKKLDVFRNKLLPRHPAVFHEWFLSTFTDPSSWYNARLAYARSLAVMSMVGYMLGLGDRHGENILFDSNSGEAMHVDFNCLFNKGLTLEVPEIVPFRLTHNLVDAMGPTKYEGFFRRACEVTMNVLREQREPLMSVLKTFIYDPLVEWSKRTRGASGSGSKEILTEKALNCVNNIDKRLRGIVAKNKGLPLSIEGHVHYLIQEATNEEHLCQMYIGWAPFM